MNRRWILTVIGLVVLIAGAGVAITIAGNDDAEPGRADGPQAETLDGCGELLGTLQARAASSVTAYGLNASSSFGFGGSPENPVVFIPMAPNNFNGGGLSLPVSVGSLRAWARDGDRLLAMAGGTLHVIDLGEGGPEVLGAVEIGSKPQTGLSTTVVVVDGDQAVVVSSELGPAPTDLADPVNAVGSPVALIATVDLSDPSDPLVAERLWVEGAVVAVHQGVGRTRVAVASGVGTFDFLAPTGPSAEAAALAANREILASSTLDDWVPRFVLQDGGGDELDSGFVGGCAGVIDPELGPGLGMVSVFDIAAETAIDPTDVAMIIGAGAVRLGDSDLDLFVVEAANPFGPFGNFQGDPNTIPPPETHVARFADSPNGLALTATGDFDGALTALVDSGPGRSELDALVTSGNPFIGPTGTDLVRLVFRTDSTIENERTAGLATDYRGIVRRSGDFTVTYRQNQFDGTDETFLYRLDGEWDEVDIDHHVGRVVEITDGRWLFIGWDDDGAVVSLHQGDADLTELARVTAPAMVLGVGTQDALAMDAAGRVVLSVFTLDPVPQFGVASITIDDTGPQPTLSLTPAARLLGIEPSEADLGRSSCREAEGGEVPSMPFFSSRPVQLRLVCEPGQSGGALGFECFDLPVETLLAQIDDPRFSGGIPGQNPFGLSERDVGRLRELAASGNRAQECSRWEYGVPEGARDAFATADGWVVLGSRSVFALAPDLTPTKTIGLEPPLG